ncbi:MAG: alpha/beta fold hydrolase [Cyanobacteria bacterium J069]|nr:MAG: triacylglycerol lipase [Cyanobacteria bacterium J069]
MSPSETSASGDRHPVILVHGIDDTAAVFRIMAPYLTSQGWQVHHPSLTPSNGSVGLEVLAQQLSDYVQDVILPGQPFDLVGFSMGGIISRYYVQRLGGLDRVRRFVTISSPHCGTWTAYLRANTGARQMSVQSPFLRDLNRDIEHLGRINFTSIWTPMDLMILPARSSCLGIGREVVLNVPAHAWMLSDPRSLRAIAQALAEPLRSVVPA